MSCAVSKWVSLCVLLEVLGVVEVAVVMAPLQSTSPVRRQCPPLPKPLSTSILQCWKTTNVVKMSLLGKMRLQDCPATCASIEPNLLYIDYGMRLGNLINKLRCLYSLQDAALNKEGLSSDLTFISPTDLSKIASYVDEIQAKPEVCTNSKWIPLMKCSNFMSEEANGSMDSSKIRNKDIVYKRGYQYTAELQNYLEKLFLANST